MLGEPGPAWHAGWRFDPESPSFRRGLLLRFHAGIGILPEPEANVRRRGMGSPEPPCGEIRVYLPAFGGVNLIFLISSTIWPSCTVPETAVIARTTLAYLSP